MYEKKLPVCVARGTLIDLETTGIDSRNNEIVTLGIVVRNQLKIIQRHEKGKDVFYKKITPIVKKLPGQFYAFNSQFERDFLAHQLGIKVIDKDLHKPWREKAENSNLKWPKLDELISHPEMYFKDQAISGKDIPILWGKYLSDGKREHLDKIVRHNEIDLLRELMLLIHYPV